MAYGEEKDPIGDIIEGNINESADPNDDEEDIHDDDLKDTQPETYQNRLNNHGKRISDAIGHKVSIKTNRKQNEVIWDVIADHTPRPESKELKKARDDHMNNVGYMGMELRSEEFKDPISECNDSSSRIQYQPVKQ